MNPPRRRSAWNTLSEEGVREGGGVKTRLGSDHLLGLLFGLANQLCAKMENLEIEDKRKTFLFPYEGRFKKRQTLSSMFSKPSNC